MHTHLRAFLLLGCALALMACAPKPAPAPLVAAVTSSDALRPVGEGAVAGWVNAAGGHSWRGIPYAAAPVGEMTEELAIGARGRKVYLTAADKANAQAWIAAGHVEAMRTPDSTLIFVPRERAELIHRDQVDCMGCLSACMFSNWAQNEEGTTGKKADPRSFCIQKTLQDIAHTSDVDTQLMFAGHNAYRFSEDPFYANGFIPTVRELVDRIATGD